MSIKGSKKKTLKLLDMNKLKSRKELESIPIDEGWRVYLLVRVGELRAGLVERSTRKCALAILQITGRVIYPCNHAKKKKRKGEK